MFKKKQTVQNQRKYRRLKAPYLLRYRVVTPGSEAQVANIKDIGAGGMRFWSDRFVPEGTFLKISFVVPPMGRTFETLGRVLRVRRAKEGSVYYMAVKFLELSREDQAVLNQFVELISSPQPALAHSA